MKLSHSIYEQKFYELQQKPMRIFFALLEKVSNQYLEEYKLHIEDYQTNPKAKFTKPLIVEFTITELKKLTMETRQDRALQALEEMLDSILNIKVKENITSTRKLVYSIFNQYSIDTGTDNITIRANLNIMKYFTDLSQGYTICDPMDILKLKNQYSEKLYFILKKWETTKNVKIPIQEFREKLNLPMSYLRADNLQTYVLDVAQKELLQFFSGLTIEKIKENGKKISHIQFTWKKSTVKPKKEKPIENNVPVETSGTKKADKIINSVLEDKKNAATKEELENVELTLEQIARAEYLLEQVDKANLSAMRKFLGNKYNKILLDRLKQEEQNND